MVVRFTVNRIIASKAKTSTESVIAVKSIWKKQQSKEGYKIAFESYEPYESFGPYKT